MHDAVAIALKRPAIGMLRLGMLAAGRLRAVHGIRRQQRAFAGVDRLQAVRPSRWIGIGRPSRYAASPRRLRRPRAAIPTARRATAE